MASTGWHTAFVKFHKEEAPDVLTGHVVCRMYDSRVGPFHVPAHTDDDVTGKVDSSGRYEHREPRRLWSLPPLRRPAWPIQV
jgi:hypothetical protein